MEILNTSVNAFLSIGTDAEVRAVLTQDATGQKAVYVGIVWWGYDTDKADQQIAANGSKQTYTQALAYFPGLKFENYRA